MFVRFVTKFRAPMPSSKPYPLRWSSSSSSANPKGQCEGGAAQQVNSTPVDVKKMPYQVVKERPSMVSETQLSRETTIRQQTQPCRMPEFYNPTTDLSRLSQSTQGSSQQQRQFAASKTYRSLTMPLKSSRLASPFPEPVKQMPSCQVSDQEKAQRMYNDSRLPGTRYH